MKQIHIKTISNKDFTNYFHAIKDGLHPSLTPDRVMATMGQSAYHLATNAGIIITCSNYQHILTKKTPHVHVCNGIYRRIA